MVGKGMTPKPQTTLPLFDMQNVPKKTAFNPPKPQITEV